VSSQEVSIPRIEKVSLCKSFTWQGLLCRQASQGAQRAEVGGHELEAALISRTRLGVVSKVLIDSPLQASSFTKPRPVVRGKEQLGLV
jgi:hypothetical protein